ncbi:hypothetical protein C5167_029138 [Papaver somniferum]|nr:hypothetical protein C5167_029138 [Papaver somniferum]
MKRSLFIQLQEDQLFQILHHEGFRFCYVEARLDNADYLRSNTYRKETLGNYKVQELGYIRG